jgi:uncharacterized protein (DUF2252 family)
MQIFSPLAADRAALLQQAQNLKMARSSHAYVRGNTAKFYEWLQAASTVVPSGPNIWICGDCHLGNLGPVVDLKGRVAIQIRDLDQTVIGNPAHDIVRLGLSLASAVRGSDLPGSTTVKVVEQLTAGYQAALTGGFAHKDKSSRPDAIQSILLRSMRRTWRDLAGDRIVGNRRRFPLGKQFWAATEEERAELGTLFERGDVRRQLTQFAHREDEAPVELLDAVYWVKGCSSLGRLRYAALVRVGKGNEAETTLVDIKEAVVAAAPRGQSANIPEDEADRVVAGARALSPNLGNRMLAVHLLGKPMVLRELMPQDLKLELDRLTADDAATLSFYLGGVVGRAHGLQLDEAERAAWLSELDRQHSPSLDAPSWLWQSVVELIGQHEAAYLEHCRVHANIAPLAQSYGRRPITT